MTLRRAAPPLLAAAALLWTFALGRWSTSGVTDVSWGAAALGEIALLLALAAIWVGGHRR